MAFTGLLIAKRGEIGLRIARATAELGFRMELAAIDDAERRKAMFEKNGRQGLRTRQDAQHRLALRIGRCDRSDGVAALERQRA